MTRVRWLDRVCGAAIFVARRRRALVELGLALPALAPAERATIARRSAELEATRRRLRLARRGDVRLCRDLACDGAAELQELRALGARGPVACVTAPLGDPALALRCLRLYGGRPDATVQLVGAGEVAGGSPVPFLGRTLRRRIEPPGADEPVVPLFAFVEADGRARFAVRAPLRVTGEGALATVLAALEREVLARPADWPWGRG